MPDIHMTVSFEWYPWTRWMDLIPFVRYPTRGPLPSRAGIYEVRDTKDGIDSERLLLLSASSKLTRLYSDLFAGPGEEQVRRRSLGSALRETVEGDLSRLQVRWAEVEWAYSFAVEWTLLQEYVQQFGQPPSLNALLPTTR